MKKMNWFLVVGMVLLSVCVVACSVELYWIYP